MLLLLRNDISSSRLVRPADLLCWNAHRIRLPVCGNGQLDELAFAFFSIVGDEIGRRIFLVSCSHVAMQLINRFNFRSRLQRRHGASFSAFARTTADNGNSWFQGANQRRIVTAVHAVMVHLVYIYLAQ